MELRTLRLGLEVRTRRRQALSFEAQLSRSHVRLSHQKNADSARDCRTTACHRKGVPETERGKRLRSSKKFVSFQTALLFNVPQSPGMCAAVPIRARGPAFFRPNDQGGT
jgi:hypothetical protein